MSQVNHPSHYNADTGIECIDVIEDWNLDFNLGNVLKYLCRAGAKASGTFVQDLQKALWYARRSITNIPYSGPIGSRVEEHEYTGKQVARAWGFLPHSPVTGTIHALYAEAHTVAGRAEVVNRINLMLMHADAETATA